MGGCVLTFADKEKSQVERKLETNIRLAKQMGLVEERVQTLRWDKEKQEWVGIAWLHS